jgi:processive 1,2-diacylglycerol beta-glucosyltransferase
MPSILIVTASTGGGHDMRANALSRWVECLTDWNAKIYRPLEQGHGLYRLGVDTYNWIQRNAPRLHHGYFGFLELAGLHRNPKRILNAERFLAAVEAFNPDVIISTHAHLNHGYFDLARERLGRSNVNCVTYCGELGGGYGFSRHWVNPDADQFIGAVDETVDAAVALGMPEDKAWSGGFMLSPDFYHEHDAKASTGHLVQNQLDMNPDEFILLLATGATGSNNHLDILAGLERRAKPVQVVALCGHNERTFDSIESWGQSASVVKVKPLRYREDMRLILRSVSAVVSRPGTGTISEAIMSGCPLILNGIGGIMPQEKLTWRYCVRHGIARTIRNAVEVGGVLDAWEQNSVELNALARNMRDRRPVRHPREILERATNCRIVDMQQDIVSPQTRREAR